MSSSQSQHVQLCLKPVSPPLACGGLCSHLWTHTTGWTLSQSLDPCSGWGWTGGHSFCLVSTLKLPTHVLSMVYLVLGFPKFYTFFSFAWFQFKVAPKCGAEVLCSVLSLRRSDEVLLWHFGLRRCLPSIQCLQQPEKTSSFSYPTEFNTECLHFYKQVLHIDNFVTDQRLEKDTHKTHQTILHIFIFNLLTSRDAIWYIEVNKFRR